MKIEKDKLKIVALALSLPSTIIAISVFVFSLTKQKIISDLTGIIIVLLVLINFFYLMMRYVFKR